MEPVRPECGQREGRYPYGSLSGLGHAICVLQLGGTGSQVLACAPRVDTAVRRDTDKRQQRDQAEADRAAGGELGFKPLPGSLVMWTLGVVGMEEEIGVDEYQRRAVPSSTSNRPPMSSMLPGLSCLARIFHQAAC